MNMKFIHVPMPDEDISSDEIRTYPKTYKVGGETKTRDVMYIPQPVAHRFFRQIFGMATSIEDRGTEILTLSLPRFTGDNVTKETCQVLRKFRLYYFIEQEGKDEPIMCFIDFQGAAPVETKYDLNKAVHTAETLAVKELIKLCAKGLEAYAPVDSEEIFDELDEIDDLEEVRKAQKAKAFGTLKKGTKEEKE